MRLIHTADWHLGRLFHGVHLTEDQAWVLDRFVELVDDVGPHAVVVAGDVYDRAVPPPEAVTLLDDVLSRIVLGRHVPVILIAGNHDSPDRLGFGSRLLAEQGLTIAGRFTSHVSPVLLADEAGPVHVYPVPYADPSTAREALGGGEITDHDTAWAGLLDGLRGRHPRGTRSVLVAHAFVVGGEESESERPLSLGGTGRVEVSRFEGFDFVAMGHLHRAQRAGTEKVQYSGSLMKYSFSEAGHEKAVNLVELDASGGVRVERIPLHARRDVRCLEGHLKDLLQGPQDGSSREDYLMVTLLDKGAILDVLGKLREVYPNVLHLERPVLEADPAAAGMSGDFRGMSHEALFASFFSQVVGEPLDGCQMAAFSSVLSRLRRQEREAEA